VADLVIARLDLQRGKPGSELVDIELEDTAPDSVCRYAALTGKLPYGPGTHPEAPGDISRS